ncbi:response regulator [Candidatus Dojkabacteria bacterium]|nr:response regulator [Candidatus Dojkabacteria bacterium]
MCKADTLCGEQILPKKLLHDKIPAPEARKLDHFAGFLCVDDDHTIHEHAEDILNLLFGEVKKYHAGDGYDAIRFLKQFENDYPGAQLIILCDNRMRMISESPDEKMNGLEMLERLRQMEQDKEVPYHHVFFHTSSDCSKKLLDRVKELGAMYVMKNRYGEISRVTTGITGVSPSINIPSDFN